MKFVPLPRPSLPFALPAPFPGGATDRSARSRNRALGLDEPPSAGKLRVAIDARLPDGLYGGVQQAVEGLAAALGELPVEAEEYVFLLHRGESEWLLPHLHGPCRPAWMRERWLYRDGPPFVRDSDGTVERMGAHVVHFTWQATFRTELPSIYQPWDLQHRHLAAFFTPTDRHRRDATYGDAFERATAIVVAADWTRRDLGEHYAVPRDRILRIPLPPPGAAAAYSESELAETRGRYGLPSAFALFPAQTWPHKNHEGLIRALVRLRDTGGPRIPLICTGWQTPFYDGVLVPLVRDLGLNSQVRFLGFVPGDDVRRLYALARLVAFPSRFEGWGLPVLEAMREGTPVICSDAASLPEAAGGAALLVDPMDEAELARQLAALWENASLRADLAARGRTRVASLSWPETARAYRALYRSVAGRPLAAEDRELLEAARA